MAIIICKSCGKKVSDTVDVCIHCGKNPKEEIVQTAEKPNEEEVTSEKTIEFYDLSEKERLALETEYIQQDKSGKKYLLDVFELTSYMKPLFFYPILAIPLLRLVFFLSEVFNLPICESNVQNEVFSTIAAISGIGLIALCACMFLYGLFKKIYNLITRARFIYFKKFQKWLAENKNIHFYPELKSARQKAVFESINIE